MKLHGWLILLLFFSVVSCSKTEDQTYPPGEQDYPVIPSSPEVPLSKWERLADSCTYVLVENFLVKDKGVFMSRPGDGKASNGIYWQQAHAIDVLSYAYRRIRERDRDRAEAYKRYIGLWFDNNANNYDTSHRQDGKYGAFFNPYTDDMAWICLTLLNFAETFNEDKYADVAKSVYDQYIITRLMTDDKGRTGLPWTNNPDKGMGLNACTNAPACALACRLCGRYKTQKYLDDALVLYRHLYNDIYNASTGRLEEPPLTYTQGTFAEACRLLFHLTGEEHFLNTAYDALYFAFNKDRCTGKVSVNGEEWRILRSEGTSMDQALFKAVLIPYAVHFVLDESVPKARRDEIRASLIRNGEMLERTLDRSSWPRMYACYFWGKTWTEWAATNQAELDKFGGTLSGYKVAMSAQASGASLMEGLARLH